MRTGINGKIFSKPGRTLKKKNQNLRTNCTSYQNEAQEKDGCALSY